MKDNIEIHSVWTGNITDQEINDFIYCVNTVFGKSPNSYLIFKKKYLDNIYGESLITLVYIDGKPVAANAKWRNDLFGRKAYQSGDTCVLQECRGKGIFRKINAQELQVLGEDALIYGFPNQNSYPGFMKFGWKEIGNYHSSLLFSNKDFIKEYKYPIDYDYANWWLTQFNYITYIKRNGFYYLTIPTAFKFIRRVIGFTDCQTAELFTKSTPLHILVYNSTVHKFYHKKKGKQPLITNGNVNFFPYWKSDVI